jgi:SynChlorMet cassette protein ScmD
MSGKLIANPSIVLREEFDDWALLYNPNNGEAYGMNPTGVFLWKHLDGNHTLEDLLAELCKDCEAVPEDARADIEKFIEDLTKQGLVGSEA